MAFRDRYAWTGATAVDRPYSVNGQNQYTSAGPASFAYDANGNLTSDGSTAFVYDVENRLVSASGAKTAALVYDPLGRLFQTSGGAAGVTQFLYDDDALIGEYDTSGYMLRRYIHGAAKGADDPLIWYENATSGWRRALVADQQGSIIAVADMNGNPLAINAYDEYGIPNANNQGRFQYTGQAWIPELGMYYYKARIYSPTLGRFLQTDPIGYEDQVNLYAYVGNDPVNAGDPTGRSGCSDMGTNTEEGGNQVGLTGTCIESAGYNAAKDRSQTVVSTSDIDTSARENMPSIRNDGGPGENSAAFVRNGENISFQPLETASGTGKSVTTGQATSPAGTVAIGHSQADLVSVSGSTSANIKPGFENRNLGDHVQVNAGRPNYIVNRNVVVVFEKSGGQFRIRVISGTVTSMQQREIRSQLGIIQRRTR